MNLLIDYFKSDYLPRNAEYLACINENLDNDLISHIYVFISDNSEFNFADNRTVIVRKKIRPTFKDMFDYCNENLRGDINIIANTDIIFDETLKIAEQIKDNQILALTRWEMSFELGKEKITPFNLATAQDVWIFKSPTKVSDDMNFTVGKWGCDNRIAKVLDGLGYDVRNPGLQIITKHFHQSNYRTNLIRIPGPYLLLVANDDINKPTEKIEVESFDEVTGQPIFK